jgi:hypothetical protein
VKIKTFPEKKPAKKQKNPKKPDGDTEFRKKQMENIFTKNQTEVRISDCR